MIKKTLNLVIVAICVFITACGNNSQKQDTTQENHEAVADVVETNVPEPEEEPTNFEPPFTVFGVREVLDKSLKTGTREWLTIELKKNGSYTATQKDERKDGEGYKWRENGTDEYSGRWTVTYRTVGESSQKVYDLHHKNGDTFVYLPDDLEYFWRNGGLFEWASDWNDCANFNYSNAFKVVEYTTPKGTKIVVPEGERVDKEFAD